MTKHNRSTSLFPPCLRASVVQINFKCLKCFCFQAAIAAFALLLLNSPTLAEKKQLAWPDRSGPKMNGIVPAEHAQGLPTEWDEESGKNIAWKIVLEGQGHASPVIGQGRVWLAAATVDGTKQYVYAIDEKTGEVIHHKLLFENAEPEPLGNNVNTYASPSCVLEEDAVYVHFGSYGTARLNPDTAEIVWQRRDIEGRHFRGPGSSPILFKGSLILTFDCIDQQFLMSLNKETGQTIWRTERSTDYDDLDEKGNPKRDGDLRKAFSTPGLIEVNGRTQVISVGSRAAFAYDAETGKELWTITHKDFNAAVRPSFFQGHAILNTGGRRSQLLSVKLDQSTQGNVDKTHVTWQREKGNSRLSTPLLYDGNIYMITDNGIASCIDAATGEEVWTGRIGGTFVASPIIANGLLYFCNEEGETAIVKTGKEFEVVAKNKLEEGQRSSPAAAHGAVFLRTFGFLYKLENE